MKIRFFKEADYRGVLPVTSPNLLVGGVEDPDGLLSPSIFGVTAKDKSTFIGYIPLGGDFIHPLVYLRIFKRSFRVIDNILKGTVKYRLDKGDFVEDENGGTGLKWFRKILTESNIYNGIKNTADQGSLITQKLREFMKNSEVSDIFMSKYPVTSLFLRDISSLGDMRSIDEVNHLYKDLVLKVKYYEENKGVALLNHYTMEYGIQNQLATIFEYHETKLFKKYGLQRKGLMSRKVRYGSRLVISSADWNGNRFNNGWLNIDTVGIPLSSVASNCVLFAIYHSKGVLDKLKTDGCMTKANGEVPKQEEIEAEYSGEAITELIDKYTESWTERVEYMRIPGTKDEYMSINLEIDGKKVRKFLTLTEFIYLLIYEPVEVEERYTMLTRYPCQGGNSISENRIHILSTNRTMKVKWVDTEMKHYPDTKDVEELTAKARNKGLDDDQRLEASSEVSAAYRETMIMSNLLLQGFSADFDGDKLASRPNFSTEANEEAKKFNNSLLSAFTADGKCFRSLDGKEAIYGLYSITYEDPKEKRVVKQDIVDTIQDMGTDGLTFKYILELMADTPKAKAPYSPTSIVKLTRWNGKSCSIDTTLGRLIFNTYCLSFLDTEYWNKPLSKNGYKDLSKRESARTVSNPDIEYFKLFKKYLNKCEELSFSCVEYFGHSLDINTYAPDEQYEKVSSKLIEEYRERVEVNNDLAAYEELETKLIEELKASHERQGVDMHIYGSGESKLSYGSDARVGSIAYGPTPIGVGAGKFKISLSNLAKGYKKSELPMYAKAMIVAGYFRSMGPATGGAIGKEIGAATTNTEIDKPGTDCGTKRYIKVTVTPYIQSNLTGRYMHTGGGKLKIIEDKDLDSLFGKTIEIRSFITCENEKCCSVCAGKTVYDVYRADETIPIGLTIPKVGDEIVQISLQKFHDAKTTYVWVDPEDFMVDTDISPVQNIISENIVDETTATNINIYILENEGGMMLREYDGVYGLPFSDADEAIPPKGSFKYILYSTKKILKKIGGDRVMNINVIRSDLKTRIKLPYCEWFDTLPEDVDTLTKELLSFNSYDKVVHSEYSIDDLHDSIGECFDEEIFESYHGDVMSAIQLDDEFILSELFDEFIDALDELGYEYTTSDDASTMYISEAANKPNKNLIKFNAAKDKLVLQRDELIKAILKGASAEKAAMKSAVKSTLEPAVTAEVKSLNAKYGTIRKGERDKLMLKVASIMEKINAKIDIKYKAELAKAKLKIYKGLGKTFAKIDEKSEAKVMKKIEKIKDKFAIKIEAAKNKIMGS